MDDDDTVLFAVLAGLGGMSLLSLVFTVAAAVLLFAWSTWQQAVELDASVAVAEQLQVASIPASVTTQPSPSAVSLALPLVAAPSELTPTSTLVPTVTPTAVSVAMKPTNVPALTPEPAPAVVVPPTPIVAPPLPSDTPVPTPILSPTATPTPNPTDTAVPTATATLTGWWVERNGTIFASSCPCDQGNTLNCGDFARSQDAQACYLRCQDLAGTDVHELDRDRDGFACEWN